MSFAWSEYLEVVKELAQGGRAHPEASLRSAVSRAYYAAFCRTRNHLRDRDGLLVPTGGEAHRFVRTQFQHSRELSRRRLGATLDRLRLVRNQADYDDTVPNLSRIAVVSLLWAEEVLATLDQMQAGGE